MHGDVVPMNALPEVQRLLLASLWHPRPSLSFVVILDGPRTIVCP